MTTSLSTLLFLCTGNSCRSQMAEGWTQHLWPDRYLAYSAGTSPQPLNPFAITVMREVGIDISHHVPKHIDTLSHITFDLIITVCDNAAQSCPRPIVITKIIHAPFDDPPRLATTAATTDEALEHYRRVRDEIGRYVQNMPSLR